MATYFLVDSYIQAGNGTPRVSDAQYRKMKKYAKDNQLDFSSKTVFSGQKGRRDLEKILSVGDTVVINDIQCIYGLTAVDCCDRYLQLMEDGISVVFIETPMINTERISKLYDVAEKYYISGKKCDAAVRLLVYAEIDRLDQERQYRSERIKEGMSISEKKPGRKEGTMEKLTPALEADITLYDNGSKKLIEIMRTHQVSRNTIKKYSKILKNRG